MHTFSSIIKLFIISLFSFVPALAADSENQVGSHVFNHNHYGANEGYGNTEEDIRARATDAELYEMDNYVDPLLVQENYQKACEQATQELQGEGRVAVGKKIQFGENQSVCDSDAQELGQVFGAQWDAMVDVATQMIPVVMGAMGMGTDQAGVTFLSRYERLKAKREGIVKDIASRKTALKAKGANPDDVATVEGNTQLADEQLRELTDERDNIDEKLNNRDSKKGNKKAQDFCKFIPIASQMSTGLFQANQAEAVMMERPEPRPGDVQREKFYQISAMHKTAKEAAYVQAGTWAATGTCYGIYAAAGAQFKAIDYVGKIGATAFLGWFYFEKAKRHQIIQKIVEKTGDEFAVNKGECHPDLQRSCYCRFAQRANDPKCIKKSTRDRAVASSMPTGCVDSRLQEDRECMCLNNNSCFNVAFDHVASLNGIPMGAYQNAMGPFNQLTRGSASANLYSPGGYGGFGARAKRRLEQAMKKAPANLGKNSLTPKEKKSAELLVKAGIPLRLARHLAKMPANKKLKDSLFGRGRYRYRRGGKKARPRTASARSVDYERGQTFGNSYSSRRSKKRRRLRRRVGSVKNNEVLRFAKRAQNNSSQIREDKSVPIWKIISIRYQKTKFGH